MRKNGYESAVRVIGAAALTGWLLCAAAPASSQDGAGRERLWRAIFKMRPLPFCDQVQIDKEAGDVQEIADETADRKWELFDERGGCDDLVIAREVGLLINIDHFEFAIIP